MLLIEHALPEVAKRPGLLQPHEVIDLLSCRRNWRVTAEHLAESLERPTDQVLHVLSYVTSLGLLSAQRIDDAWYYGLDAA